MEHSENKMDCSKIIIVKPGIYCRQPRSIRAPIPSTSKTELVESGEDLYLYQVSDDKLNTGM